MQMTSMSCLRSMVRPSLSQPKLAWTNPAVFSAGVGSLKMKRNRLVIVVRKDFSTEGKPLSVRRGNGNIVHMSQPRDGGIYPKFVIFVRNANLKKRRFLPSKKKEWFPLAMVEGSLTAQEMISDRKTTSDTIARELASVIYKDEKKIEKEAKLKLKNATKFRYGFKFVVNGNMEAAKSIKDVFELPENVDTSEAKEPFGILTSLGSI